MADTKQGDPLTDDGESSGEGSHSESQLNESGALSDLQVCASSVKRGRGRPKLSGIKPNIKEGVSPKKRGRPKSSTVKEADDKLDSCGEEIEEGPTPKLKRGHPKGPPKKLVHKIGTCDEDGAEQDTPKRGRPKKGQAKGNRGRPKKLAQEGATHEEKVADGSPRKMPGRPKGSQNKPVLTVRVESTSGRPTRVHVAPEKLNIFLPRKSPGKRGRPKKISRGRPRKNPLPPEEELYQPRVWKALGRPRKYPKENQPGGASSPGTPRRGRGRPRKSDSKKGAHLKKFNVDGTPNKPKAVKEQDGSPRKRGRPKGSVKSKAVSDNNSEKISQDSDQSKKGVHEDVSNSTPLEENGSNHDLL